MTYCVDDDGQPAGLSGLRQLSGWEGEDLRTAAVRNVAIEALRYIGNLEAERDRAREALREIADERGHCSLCGLPAEGDGAGYVACTERRGCTWAPMNAPEHARRALSQDPAP